MYGMVNKAIQQMVTMHFGEETWERIRLAAGVDEEVFISNEPYPDEVTYKLAGAASETLGWPLEKVLIAFGEHWVLHTAMDGYGALMKSGGRNFAEFLINLPRFHARVELIFPNLAPPSFECTDITDTSLMLHYRTHRRGLSPFVIGLVQGLGKLFSTEVSVALKESRDAGADHDVFFVQWNDPIQKS